MNTSPLDRESTRHLNGFVYYVAHSIGSHLYVGIPCGAEEAPLALRSSEHTGAPHISYAGLQVYRADRVRSRSTTFHEQHARRPVKLCKRADARITGLMVGELAASSRAERPSNSPTGRARARYWLKRDQTVNLDSARQGEGSIPSSPTTCPFSSARSEHSTDNREVVSSNLTGGTNTRVWRLDDAGPRSLRLTEVPEPLGSFARVRPIMPNGRTHSSMVEHRPVKPGVVGSSPTESANPMVRVASWALGSTWGRPSASTTVPPGAQAHFTERRTT